MNKEEMSPVMCGEKMYFAYVTPDKHLPGAGVIDHWPLEGKMWQQYTGEQIPVYTEGEEILSMLAWHICKGHEITFVEDYHKKRLDHFKKWGRR